ncbi:MAG: cob(I)yrinic acid a,c-diamide adenosyltransferase [Betaproteobacteria bacterium HGW-Betaproteobacteria-11]|nr:MAG: cob(I)yrinic acid a,c-diamide adenosyltransferase [Betaproteobacteria bacterium HGW-Betaproteobacteria-11]
MADEKHILRMQRKKRIIDEKIATASSERGLLLVNTGTGKGKSSAAFGVLARALGHGFNAGVVQFVKSRSDTGEESFFRRQPDVAWYVMGEGFTWETQDKDRDAQAARAAWRQSRLFLEDESLRLVILDELTYAFKYGWLDLDEVLCDLEARPRMQHVIVTGRAAPEKLIAAADTVTDMHLLKHAFTAGLKAMPGIEF